MRQVRRVEHPQETIRHRIREGRVVDMKVQLDKVDLRAI
jgi:hypothetical protein